MDDTIRQKIIELKGDPDFVAFIMGWHGVIGATEVPFTTQKESQAYQKKIKRWTEEDFRTQWRFYWKVISNECWKARRQIVLQRNLFKLEPRWPQSQPSPTQPGRLEYDI